MELTETVVPQVAPSAPIETVTPPKDGLSVPKETVPPAEPPKESPVAAVAKEKRQFLMMKRELDKMRAQNAELASKLQTLTPTEQKKAKLTPIEALEAQGWSYKDAADYVMNNNQMTPEQKLKLIEERITSTEQRLLDEKKSVAEAQAKRAQEEAREAEDNFKVNIEDFVEVNAEKFELVKHYGKEAIETVYDTIKTHFEAGHKAWSEDPETNPKPKLLTIEQAAQLVENYYEEQAIKIASLKKLQAKLAPKTDAPKVESPKKPSGESVTLSNIPSSSAPSMLPAKTETDRIKRALAALEMQA